MLNQNLLLAGDDAYNLTKSLRLRSSASAYLNRTPASATNQKTWTWSAWVKRGELSAQSIPFGAGTSNASRFAFFFNSDNTISLVGTNTTAVLNMDVAPVYRDPSGWYHIVIALDTTQATAANRAKLYINNVQVTNFNGTPTYPAQNTDLQVNSANPHTLGVRGTYSVTDPFDGYLTEVNFIDGQALTPSSFGETDVLTGVWKAKKYSGTYGTNGFYLPFSDNTSTTTLGYDKSGNSNNWTCNNISLTAGSTYDSMVDVPTLTSATQANYATLNPLMYRVSNTPSATLSNGNLTSTHTPSAYGTYVFSTIAGIGNKFYYEVTITSLVGGGDVGIDNGQGQYSLSTGRAVYLNDGRKIINGSISAYGASFTTGDVIGVAFDLINGTITFYKNGTSQGVASSSIGTSAYFSFGEGDTGTVYNWNYGQRPFTYTPPTGFVALNTFNLPEPSIKQGNKHFDATLYTGNSGTQSIVNAAGFQPDLVWVKGRSLAYDHGLFDSVRGVQKVLASNGTGAENYGGTGELSAFNSNGFTLVNSANYGTNLSPNSYVGWQWKANGTGSSNTAGSITSTVSANPTAGFSVVTYTGTGANATVGHGLGIAPKMVICKARTVGANPNPYWSVYHASLGATQIVFLDRTDATSTNSAPWNNTAPTSSVFSLGNGNSTNYNGNTFVAYCFAEVAGYSKFGSYTGNGSTDGTFVHLGFRPKFLLIKSTGVESWELFDTSRSSYNAAVNLLEANDSAAETTSSTTVFDMLSSGFKLRNTRAAMNTNNQTYVYMAFAENPFKYSLAR